jgi:hypothetical protein
VRVEEIALKVVDALTAIEIPYMLVGSFSSNYYGIPRSTKDVDFVIELGAKRIADLRSYLQDDFSFDPQMAFETFTGTTKNVVQAKGTEFEVELFHLSKDPHDRQRFARRQCVRLFDRNIFLPTVEDVIVTKLRWLRPKDRDDLMNVIAVQDAALDWGYIYQWADAHATREVLDEIRASIPEI